VVFAIKEMPGARVHASGKDGPIAYDEL
jgi:hypothetical protein